MKNNFSTFLRINPFRNIIPAKRIFPPDFITTIKLKGLFNLFIKYEKDIE